MALASWARKLVGSTVKAPGGLGGQCVDLANLWLGSLGDPMVRLNAVDWRSAALPPPWRWVPNKPTNYPHAGSLVVWGEDSVIGTGPYGHIAVVVTADPAALLTVDQDWPLGSPVALTWHTYQGIQGWWGL